MKNKQHIKRCPFCGGKSLIREDLSGRSYIQCSRRGCGVETPHRLDYKMALLAWNSRIGGEQH